MRIPGVDCHKTLNTPYDSGVVICRDKEALIDALHMSGAYIITGKGRDGMFYTTGMSRLSMIQAVLQKFDLKLFSDRLNN